MNYLSYIEHAMRQAKRPTQFLVSGETQAHEVLLKQIIRKAYSENHTLLVIDDTKDSIGVVEKLTTEGYCVINGLSGMFIFNPFNITTFTNTSKLRELLRTFQMTEKEQQKVVAYLSFIQHMRLLEGNSTNLTLSVLAKEYSTYESVVRKLDDMVRGRIINNDEMYFLLSKYSELSSIGADLENIFPLLQPFVEEISIKLTEKELQKSAVVLQTGRLGRDQNLKQMVIQLLKFGIDEDSKFNTVIYIDSGNGRREELHYLCTELCSSVTLNILSKDIFTAPSSMLPEILKRSEIKIYGRHNMSSAGLLENELGEVYVQKSTYNETLDRRIASNKPWDVLLGRNKTQGYQTLAPVKEALYSKELLSTLKSNQIILDLSGRKIMTTL